MVFYEKQFKIHVKPINFIMRNLGDLAQCSNFVHLREFIFFPDIMGPQRVDLMPWWTEIFIQLVSVILVDWVTSTPTVNKP